jgi:hypothetical protein
MMISGFQTQIVCKGLSKAAADPAVPPTVLSGRSPVILAEKARPASGSPQRRQGHVTFCAELHLSWWKLLWKSQFDISET